MSRRIIIFVLAAGAAAFGAIAISQAASTSGSRPTNDTATRKARVGTGVLYRRFSILRSAQASASSADTLPAATAEHLTEPGTMVSEYKIEPDNARSLDVNGTHAWVIPGTNGICLAIPAPDGSAIAISCGPLASTSKGGILTVHRPSSGPIVYGLVPNGDSVSVTNQDGSHSNVPVTSNFFMYSRPSAQSVAIHGSGGSVVEAVTLAKP
jgi:hypothetical protein